MSRLTELMRRYQQTRVVHGIVDYLEGVDIPGPMKKAIAMAVVKAVYTKTGGKWDKQVAAAVGGAIEWALAEVREWADDFYPDPEPTPTPPKQGPFDTLVEAVEAAKAKSKYHGVIAVEDGFKIFDTRMMPAKTKWVWKPGDPEPEPAGEAGP